MCHVYDKLTKIWLSIDCRSMLCYYSCASQDLPRINNYIYFSFVWVSDLRQVSGFFVVLRFPPPSKRTATILLKYKVALNTITHHPFFCLSGILTFGYLPNINCIRATEMIHAIVIDTAGAFFPRHWFGSNNITVSSHRRHFRSYNQSQ